MRAAPLGTSLLFALAAACPKAGTSSTTEGMPPIAPAPSSSGSVSATPIASQSVSASTSASAAWSNARGPCAHDIDCRIYRACCEASLLCGNAQDEKNNEQLCGLVTCAGDAKPPAPIHCACTAGRCTPTPS